jgi:WD40 repeat protein
MTPPPTPHRGSRLGAAWLSAAVLLGGVPFRAFSQDGDEAAEKAIEVAQVKREAPADFEKDILPLFRRSCLACHNASEAKGDLVLESPATILAGADGEPVVVPGKSEESLLLQVAARRSRPAMPPLRNKVGASPLAPEELGLLKLWIDEGAKGSLSVAGEGARWYPLPAGPGPIYAVALTGDGQIAACGRANQVFLYSVATGEELERLTDPRLLETGIYDRPGVAHLDSVQALAFDPRSELLASAGFRTVKLWRRSPAAARKSLAGAASALALSADGAWLAWGDQDGALGIEEVSGSVPAEKASVLLEKRAMPISALAFSPAGGVLSAAALDGSLTFWSAPEGKKVGEVKLAAPGRAAAIIDGGAQILLGCDDGVLRAFKVPASPEDAAGVTGEPLLELKAHEKPVTALAAVPSGPLQCLTGSEDGMVRHFDLAAKKALREHNHEAPITAVAVRPDGKVFASATSQRKVRLWQAADGKEIAAMTGDHRTLPAVALESRLEKLFAARVEDAKKAIQEAENEAKKRVEEEKKAAEELDKAEKALAAKKEEAAKLAGDTDGDADKGKVEKAMKEVQAAEGAREAAAGARDRARTAKEEAEGRIVTRQGELKGAEEAVKAPQARLADARKRAEESAPAIRALAFSPDNLRLAGGAESGNVHVWSAEDGAAFEVLAAHDGPVAALAFRGPRDLATAGPAARILWDLGPTWKLERQIGAVDDPGTFADRVTALAFSADGRLLAVVSAEPSRRGELKVWKVEDGSLLWSQPDAHTDAVFALEFSLDGRYLASSSADKFVKVFSTEDGKLVRSFEGHTGHVLGVSWRWDGKVLASCGADKVVKVWNFASGSPERSIGGYEKQVTSIRFVGDSENVVACSGDRKVRLQRTNDGGTARDFGGAGDYMYSVDVTRDGSRVAAGGFDGVLRVWDGNDGRALRAFEAPAAGAAAAE